MNKLTKNGTETEARTADDGVMRTERRNVSPSLTGDENGDVTGRILEAEGT